MTTLSELSDVFGFHPQTPKIRALGIEAALLREVDTEATAISIVVQLLHLRDLTPSGKFLHLQLQPRDALSVATTILAHAVDKGWSIDGELSELNNAFKFRRRNTKHRILSPIRCRRHRQRIGCFINSGLKSGSPSHIDPFD
jgi:hypothetical protein